MWHLADVGLVPNVSRQHGDLIFKRVETFNDWLEKLGTHHPLTWSSKKNGDVKIQLHILYYFR
jgi:hypothetical protein